jgi:hypothetical protein
MLMERMLCCIVSVVQGGSDVPEPRPIASWLAQVTVDAMARPGWQPLRGYAVWGRRIDGAGLEIALKPVLATQVSRAPKEIADMSDTMLSRLAKRHRIGRSEPISVRGCPAFRATVINADFVAQCLVGDIWATMTHEEFMQRKAEKAAKK